MKKQRVYARYTIEASLLLGKLIRWHRKKLKISLENLSDRACISRTTLRKIERGEVTCEIGLVFEVATLVGIKLFEADYGTLKAQNERVEDKIALLPKSIQPQEKDLEDDF